MNLSFPILVMGWRIPSSGVASFSVHLSSSSPLGSQKRSFHAGSPVCPDPLCPLPSSVPLTRQLWFPCGCPSACSSGDPQGPYRSPGLCGPRSSSSGFHLTPSGSPSLPPLAPLNVRALWASPPLSASSSSYIPGLLTLLI